MAWVYQQKTGVLFTPLGERAGQGYSGNPPFVNDPRAEDRVGEGPLPRGKYRVTGPPKDTAAHGPYVLRLDPDALTSERIKGYGRDPASFLVHGKLVQEFGKATGQASKGCLCLDRPERVALWTSQDHELLVF